jgi:peptidoglycan-N-acetylglucosamine deacetylase
MDPFAAGEEAATSLPVTSTNSQYFLTLFIVFFLLACREKEERISAPNGASPDSAALRSKGIPGNRQSTPDTLVKAAHFKMKVYLTFDDGPNAGTMNVIDAVTAEQVPASFFVVAKHV